MEAPVCLERSMLAKPAAGHGARAVQGQGAGGCFSSRRRDGILHITEIIPHTRHITFTCVLTTNTRLFRQAPFLFARKKFPPTSYWAVMSAKTKTYSGGGMVRSTGFEPVIEGGQAPHTAGTKRGQIGVSHSDASSSHGQAEDSMEQTGDNIAHGPCCTYVADPILREICKKWPSLPKWARKAVASIVNSSA
jgi:hypothetical protein